MAAVEGQEGEHPYYNYYNTEGGVGGVGAESGDSAEGWAPQGSYNPQMTPQEEPSGGVTVGERDNSGDSPSPIPLLSTLYSIREHRSNDNNSINNNNATPQKSSSFLVPHPLLSSTKKASFSSVSSLSAKPSAPKTPVPISVSSKRALWETDSVKVDHLTSSPSHYNRTHSRSFLLLNNNNNNGVISPYDKGAVGEGEGTMSQRSEVSASFRRPPPPKSNPLHSASFKKKMSSGMMVGGSSSYKLRGVGGEDPIEEENTMTDEEK